MKRQIALVDTSIKHKSELTSLNVISVLNGDKMRKIYVVNSTMELIEKFNKPEKFYTIFDIFDNTIVINRDMVATIDCIVATKVTLEKPTTSKGLTRFENWFFGECEIHEGFMMTSENQAKPIPESEDNQICG